MDGSTFPRRPFTYGSVCSGIEAASVAWHPLGWRAAFLSEIEPFPRAVLTHHYPATPLHGDFTTIEAGQYEPIDLLVGGTPCQSFSIAGLRGGLADERGNLALQFLHLADRLRPRWVCWENVPGVFSSITHEAPDPCPPPHDMAEGSEWVGEDEYDSDEDHAFACFLAGFSELGYGFAYRVFDAQFFGLAQRRKRVFVVGYLGDWRRAAAVLFEPASLRRHPAPRRTAGENAAGTLSARATAGGGLGTDFECSGGLVAHTLRVPSHGATWRGDGCDNLVAHTLRAEGHDASEDGTRRGVPLVPVYAIQERAVCQNPDAGPDGAGFREGLAYTLEARQQVQSVVQPYTLAIRGRGDSHDLEYRQDGTANALPTPTGGRGGIGVGAVAFDVAQITSAANRTNEAPGLPASTISAGSNMHVAQRAAVRRLTPVECERLQGFPDGYTDVPFRGKPAADGNRYRALGNSMAVPCMAWIGRRIAVVDAQP